LSVRVVARIKRVWIELDRMRTLTRSAADKTHVSVLRTVTSIVRGDRDSLRLRLPLAIGAILVAVLTGFVLVTRHELQRALDQTGGERAQVAADQIAALLAQSSTRTLNQIRRAAVNPAVVALLRNRTVATEAAARDALLPLVAGAQPVMVLNTGGDIVFSVAGPGSVSADTSVTPASASPAGRPLGAFRSVAGRVVFDAGGDVLESEAGEQQGKRGDRVRLGSIVVRRTLSSGQTADFIARLVGTGASVAIGNQTGNLWTDLSAQIVAPRIDARRRGVAQYKDTSGTWRLGASALVTDTPWAVWVEFPRDRVLAPVTAVVDQMKWLTAGFVLGTVVLVAGLTQRLTRPLNELTQAAEAIAAGDYSRRVAIRRHDEIGRLGVAFNTMTAQVEGARRDLEQRVQQRTERLAVAMTELDQFFALSKDLLCIADGEGRFKRVNEAWHDVLGWTAEELTAVPFADFIHPDDQHATSMEVATLAHGEPTLDFENRYRCKDGSYRWLQWNATPARHDGLVYAAARDVTEQRRLKDEIEHRMTEVADANRELEAFSYSVSHDLRAPLRHIAGFAALLHRAAGPSLDEQSTRYLETITEATSRMGRLIDDLLAFSRMARTDLVKQRVKLADVVTDVQGELQSDVETRTVRWTVDPLPVVNADKAMLRVVLMNLMANALKYTSPRSTANIQIGANGHGRGEVVIFVRDNGVGFDMQYAHKLFGVFQRLHRAEEFEGTGIGLATVRRIIQRHGGRVWAESAVDQGATFFFSLPTA
jgi:PAS domain S-box-containing protein